MENIPELGSGMGYFGSRKGYHGGIERQRTICCPTGYDDSILKMNALLKMGPIKSIQHFKIKTLVVHEMK
jgi:hypothetical protein